MGSISVRRLALPLKYYNQNLRLMFEDMVYEALWPTQVSSAIDVFPTGRYEADSRLKGTIDLSNYTSESEYPLIGWKCLQATPLEGVGVISGRVWSLSGEIKIAAVGVEDIDSATTAVSATLIDDVARAAGAIVAQLDDGRCLDGPFALYDATLIGGKDSTAAYNIWSASTGEPEIGRASVGSGEEGGEDEFGADDRLGFNVWIGTLPVEILVLVV